MYKEGARIEWVAALISTSVVISAWAAVVASPDNPASPLDILKQANAAAAKLTTISYEARFHGEGETADRFPKLTGKVLAKRGPDDRQHRLLIEGAVTRPGSDQSAAFKFAIDGQKVCFLDLQSKSFTFGTIEEAGQAVSNPLFQPKYLHQTPFNSEIEGGNPQIKGEQTVDGVACHVIEVNNKEAQAPTARLFIGKEDFLLRRFEMTVELRPAFGGKGPTGQLVFDATGLKANPPVDEAVFRLDCPDGFQKQSFVEAQNPSTPGLLPVGSEAPDWTMKTAEGQTITLKSLRGKAVVLDFWATWCGPCKMAMPTLQKLHQRFKDRPVAIFGVNCRERSPNADPMAYIKQQGYTYGQLLNGDAVATAYRVGGIPCFYIIGPDGRVLSAHAGFNPQMEQFAAGIIQKALDRDSASAAAPTSRPADVAGGPGQGNAVPG